MPDKRTLYPIENQVSDEVDLSEESGKSNATVDRKNINPEQEFSPIIIDEEKQEHNGSIKNRISHAVFTYNDWRRLQREIREFPKEARQNFDRIQKDLNDYRLSSIHLNYRAQKLDEEIWNLYKQIQPDLPRLIKESGGKPLSLRSRRRLLALWQSWKDFIKKQEQLLNLIANAPKTHEFYNRIQIIRKQRQTERKKQAENALKIAFARKSLEMAIGQLEENSQANEELIYGSKILRLEDAESFWKRKLDEYSLMGERGPVNADEVILSINRLEQAIREVPESVRLIRSIEDKYSQLLATHDMLVSFGQSVIPQKEIARTSSMMYDQVPKYWTTGNQDELQRTLKILDSFISYYEKKVEAELAIAERRRPGITQNLAMGPSTDKNLISPLMAMVRSFASAVDSRDRFMRGHSEKVARIAVLIGRRINMNETDIENLEMASLLHDIGKISVPESVLTKTQPLT
ncbi:MAG: HD-GYP domain-containing protein, partial [Omnitrophica WOR_2 bacterium]